MNKLTAPFAVTRVDQWVLFSTLFAKTNFTGASEVLFNFVGVFIEFQMRGFLKCVSSVIISDLDDQVLHTAQSQNVSGF